MHTGDLALTGAGGELGQGAQGEGHGQDGKQGQELSGLEHTGEYLLIIGSGPTLTPIGIKINPRVKFVPIKSFSQKTPGKKEVSCPPSLTREGLLSYNRGVLERL